MRGIWCLAVFVAALAAACGNGAPSPESVVRAWSQELNSGDNERAADLFAPGATVIQGSTVRILRTHADAVAWNASLPCSGQILAIRTRGDTARATFLLGHRRESKCDGPGSKATALFRVHEGKIVLWHQTGSSPPADGGPI